LLDKKLNKDSALNGRLQLKNESNKKRRSAYLRRRQGKKEQACGMLKIRKMVIKKERRSDEIESEKDNEIYAKVIWGVRPRQKCCQGMHH